MNEWVDGCYELLEIIILMIKDMGEKATAIKVFVRVRPLVGP